MSVITYTIDDFSMRIGDGLRLHFKSDQFFDEEIREVTLGLVNSVRWSAVRIAEAYSVGGFLSESVDDISTDDHFASDWMLKEEIIARIEDTSGLTTPYAEYCLEIIEKVVDMVVNRGDSLHLPFLGEIRASEPGKYKISLTDGLRVRSSDIRPASFSAEETDSEKVTDQKDSTEMKTRTAGSGE